MREEFVMGKFISDIAFTPSVKAVQERQGSRNGYAKMEQKGGWNNKVTPDLAGFIGERDSFYMATASREGRPYIQHRGGPKGFLKVLDEQTLAFADFAGNRQYISMGNLDENDQAFIFLMDYANRRRVKIWGRVEVIEDNAELLQKLSHPDYLAKPERVFIFHIDAWDVNCPQHIPQKFSEAEINEIVRPFQGRIKELEAQVKELRGG
jgi:predicted pyridoxine 5'-phosphate oxidase superfamily flavin-nucleotide-binding protein